MPRAARSALLLTGLVAAGVLAVVALALGASSAGWALGQPPPQPGHKSAVGHAHGRGPRPAPPRPSAGGNVVVSIAPLPKGFRADCHVAANVPCYQPGSPCTASEAGRTQPGWEGPVVCADAGGWQWVTDGGSSLLRPPSLNSR